MKLRPLAVLGAVALWGMTSWSCVTEPKPLDKTQDESIHKSVFEGEWYYKVTVIDTDWHNQYTFIGEQSWNMDGGGAKIRWEITQDYLHGYLMPQKYRDPSGNLVENTIGKESLALSFRIERHFDIKYLENNTTREDLNVIVENTDRPWNEREYIIVDWSKNLATDWWQPLALDESAGGIIREPVSSWRNVEFFDVNDERVNTKKWRPGKDPDIYALNIDVQEQFHASIRRWWEVFYGAMEPVRVRLRISMMKKDPDGAPERTYEPLTYRDEFFRRFGYFRTEFETFDPDRGPLESQKQYLANRFDVGCYTDPDTGAESCKKIVFYMSPTTPTAEEDPDLVTWVGDAVNAWNEVFQEATGRTDRVVELRPNEPLLDRNGDPVLDSEGKPRYKYEIGDIRYNFVNYVTKPLSYGLLGYGPSTPDPDTGEIINGVANFYGTWLDVSLAKAMDYYDVVAGNCTLEDIQAGHYWDEDAQACTGGAETIVAKGRRRKADMHFITPALATAYWPKGRVNKPSERLDRQELEARRPMARLMFDEHAKDQRALDLGKMTIHAGTGYERQMVPSATFGSTFPGARSVDEVMGDFSVANRLTAQNLQKMKDFYTKRSKHCILEVDHFDNSIIAFVEDMKDRSREEVYRELRHWMLYTTVVHEMGHTLGLRHNFKASADKVNADNQFHIEYNLWWQEVERLRAELGPAIESGDASAYKQYIESVNAIPTAQDRYGGTSVMDYTRYFDGWFPKVGSYDRAAILFAYGQKIEVRDSGVWQVVDYEPGDFVKDDLYDYAAESASGRVVRYYMNCSDERVWDDFFCMRHDRGTTAVEIMRNFIQDSYKSYFFSNFKRDRILFGDYTSYYIYRWLFTYLMYAKAFAQITVHNIWYEEFWDSLWDGLETMANGPETREMVPGYMRTGGEDLLRASLLFYYYLLHDVLQRPDYGLHELVYDTKGNRFWESTKPQYTTADSITASIDAGPGWGWNDKWDSQYDQTIYYDKLIRMGVEIDKIIAYEMLSIPAVFNEYLWHEKANGTSFWNDLWTGNGMQLWKITRGFIGNGFKHDQNPWCMNAQGNLLAMPFDLLEGAAFGQLIERNIFSGESRCPEGYHPVQPGMDDLFAIYPIFFGISGSQHPWYYNNLSDYMDSQVLGGNHRFDVPPGVETAEFTNSTGTKTYQAAESSDGLSVSFDLVSRGRDIANRIKMVQTCNEGGTPTLGLPGTHGRDCAGVMACYGNTSTPSYCDPEGWDSLYLYPILAYRDLDRIEAMLIMMQDMIDLAGHYAWYTPGYLDPP